MEDLRNLNEKRKNYLTELFGSVFAVIRYSRYIGLGFKYHSEYFGYQIERCYDGPQPKALYRILVPDDESQKMIIVVGESLDTVKSAFRRYREAQ